MNKKLIVIGTAILLLVVGLSGCDEPKTEPEYKASWEVVMEESVVSDISGECSKGRFEAEGISQASITIKNTGYKATTYIVDFGFEHMEIPDEGIWFFSKDGEASSHSITAFTDIQYQQQTTIPPGGTRKVTCSTNPYVDDCLFVSKWCYEINPMLG